MKSLLVRLLALCAALVLIVQAPQSALACATCGCSEVCALNLFNNSVETSRSKSMLSDSIWGRLILGIAYNRDPVLRKLGLGTKIVSGTSRLALSGAGALTLPQGISSLMCLYENPDNVAPPIMGIVVESITNVALWSRMVINAPLRHEIRKRQALVRGKVEMILTHLEHSEWSCPQAQEQLTGLIGPKAAEECVKLWQTSHMLASTEGADESVKEK